MKRSGMYVETKTGKKGLVYNDDSVHEDKVKVYLVDDEFQPILNKAGNDTLKMLCTQDSLKLIGFFN